MSDGGRREGALVAELRALREVLRSPDLRRLQLAWLVTSIGVWGSALTLAVYAYESAGATAVGLMALFRTLPGAPAAPLLALVADRRSRRSVLVVTNALRAATLGVTAAAVAADAPIGVVYALAALLAVIGPMYKPCQSALLPALARTPAQLSSANVAAAMLTNLGFVIGSVCCGLLLTAVDPAAVMGVCAAALAASMVPLVRIRRDERARPDPDARPGLQALEGFAAVRADAQMRELVGLTGALSVVEGAVDVLAIVAAVSLLGMGEAGAGSLWAAWGVGAIAGGGVAVGLLSRRRLTAGFTLGSVALGVFTAAIGFLPPVLAAASLAGAGAGYTVVEVAAYTLLQRLTADHVMARVFGVVEGLYVLGAAAGSVVAGLLVDAFGVRPALVAVGVLMPAVALVRRSRLARLEAGAPVAEREYGLLRGNAIFAPLPVHATEHLARQLIELRPAPGSEVIAEGDVGERFYIVAQGVLDVFERGSFRRTLGAGDGFGEIALLRDVPRTATVRAREGVAVLALDREPFIEAVTGQRYSERAAAALVEERLHGPPAPSA